MLTLPPLALPQEFCQLLRHNQHQAYNHQQNTTSLYHLIISSEHLSQLIEKIFHHLQPQGKVHHFLRSLGWKNFRDRLAYIYIYHFEHGCYPETTDIELPSSLLKNERLLDPYTVDGHSRAFLLFFYLHLINRYHQKESLQEDLLAYQIPDYVFSILNQSAQKIWDIDWIVLILWHFGEYLGSEKLSTILKNKNVNYQQIFEDLESAQQSQMMTNLINYSYSTHDMTPISDPMK